MCWVRCIKPAPERARGEGQNCGGGYDESTSSPSERLSLALLLALSFQEGRPLAVSG